MLRDVSKRNLKSKLLGKDVEHIFGFAPTAQHRIAHPDGELATARAAAQTGTPMILSTLSSVKLEDVAASYYQHNNNPQNPLLWFQLYVFKDRSVTYDLVKRVELNGFTALVVTIDTPISGIRYKNLRRQLALPSDMKFSNLVDYFSIEDSPQDNFFSHIVSNFDDSLTWDILMKYLRSITSLPIILKGILTVEDAKLSLEFGADGIIVSNHGARQLDTVPSTLECLNKIVPFVPQHFNVYLDGGIRSGDDILKAVALGAKAVFLGRPTLWALNYGGSNGLITLVNMLKMELDVSMALNGMNDINNVPRDLVIRSSEFYC